MTVPFSDANIPAGSQNVPDVQVVIRPVPFDDQNAKYKDGPDDGSIIADYRIFNRYERDLHRHMLGVTSPGGSPDAAGTAGSVAFVQLANPTLLWVSRWTVCQSSKQPPIPDPESADPNWVLLDDHLETVNVTVGPNGETPIYRISGTYVYGCRNPDRKLIHNINFALPPYLENVFDRTVPDNALTQNIINLQGLNQQPVNVGNARIVT